VTAGSILRSLAEILSNPSSILKLLGLSLPSMVGWFVALFVTKILAGLPMIFLRFGALTRMLLLRILSDEKKLTQRELDAVYRLENVQYGWEFPAQVGIARMRAVMGDVVRCRNILSSLSSFISYSFFAW
jgi:hypothetical protein